MSETSAACMMQSVMSCVVLQSLGRKLGSKATVFPADCPRQYEKLRSLSAREIMERPSALSGTTLTWSVLKSPPVPTALIGRAKQSSSEGRKRGQQGSVCPLGSRPNLNQISDVDLERRRLRKAVSQKEKGPCAGPPKSVWLAG